MATAVAGVDLIVLSVPGPGHEKYLSALKPHLPEGMNLYMNPGHSGGALHAVHLLGRQHHVAESNTLSYIARKTDEQTVYVSSSDKPVKVGVFPAHKADTVLTKIKKVFPHISPAKNVLETTFCNINAMFHPPGMLFNAGWIEFTKGNFKFYCEGITPGIGRVVDLLDIERRRIAKAYGLDLDSFCQTLYDAGSTSPVGRDANLAYIACQESDPNRFITAPPSLDNRYMHEDICSGLVPMSELGHACGIIPPLMDSLIVAAGALMNRNYRGEGVNIAKMGLRGMTSEEIVKYVS
jgi:opine dehydrogenase